MKSLIVPLLATASFSTFLICGMVAASSLHIGYTPHKFAHIDDAIWTSTPIRVDQPGQETARETAQLADEKTRDDRQVATASAHAGIAPDIAGSGNFDQASAEATSGAASWCQARYRSYRVSDNSYQPFDSSERRQCEPPATLSSNS